MLRTINFLICFCKTNLLYLVVSYSMEPHASNVDQLLIIFGRDFLESPPVFKFHGMYGVYVDVYVCVKGGGVVFFFEHP